MQKYKILIDEIVDAQNVVMGVKGDLIDLNPEDKDTKDFLSAGIVEPALVDETYLETHPDTTLKIGDPVPADTIAAKKEDETKVKKEDDLDVGTVPEKVLMYKGKKVITTAPRVVNGITHQEVKLEDGTTFDLTPAEYEADVTVAE